MTTQIERRTATDVVKEIFRILFEERDLSRGSEFWSEDTVDHFTAAGETVRGTTALRAWFGELFTAFPDWSVEILNCFDDGDRQATVQWRARGTFTGGAFLGLEPTGRSIVLEGVDVFRFDEDWRVAEGTVYYDGAEFARQVGMLPARDSAGDRLTLAAFNARVRLARRLRSRRAEPLA